MAAYLVMRRVGDEGKFDSLGYHLDYTQAVDDATERAADDLRGSFFVLRIEITANQMRERAKKHRAKYSSI